MTVLPAVTRRRVPSGGGGSGAGSGGRRLPVLALLGGLLAAYLVVPVALTLTRLGPGHWAGIGSASVWSALGTSVTASTIATAAVLVTGVPLAWTLARPRGPGWRRRLAAAVGVGVQIPLALPPLVSGLLLIRVLGPYTFLGRVSGGRLTESLWGIVFAQAFVAGPFLVVAARSAFAAVDPSLGAVAATLGHGRWSRFVRVDLAEALPGIRAGTTLTWLRAFGEFGATVLLAYHPYSLPVFTYVQFDSSGLAATQVPVDLAIATAVVVVAVSQIRLPRRVAARPPAAAPPGRAPAATLDFSVRADMDGFDLAVAHRASSPRLALLGRSGAGKSLTLQLLAGVLPSAGGWIRLGATDLGPLHAEHRGVGYVPQGGGLVPRLDVWRQVNFSPSARPELASWWLDRLGLDGLEARRPTQISGGQAQRVALARALAGSARLLLLDEPLSALDTPSRRTLRAELRQLQLATGLATVVVTHDPEEAAILADDIIVLSDGAVLQAGSRRELFRRPASVAVARLLGLDNVHPGRLVAPGVVSAGAGAGAGVLLPSLSSGPPGPPGTPGFDGVVPGDPVLWSVEPEAVAAGPRGRWPARVVDVVDMGRQVQASLELAAGVLLVSRHPGAEALLAGADTRVDLPPVEAWAVPPAPGVAAAMGGAAPGT